jgi:hypothetical protein
MDHDRFRSWVKDDAGKPTKEKRLVVGVIAPDIVSMRVFGAYQLGSLG